jgi:hypothetical protein
VSAILTGWHRQRVSLSIKVGSHDFMHIAHIDFSEFFSPAFPSMEAARAFVERVERLDGPAPAKLALHQAARMLWLADRVDEVARGRPALEILFYLIAAEAVAKIASGFKGEGRSKAYVRRFFGEICSDEHRRRLRTAFTGSNMKGESPAWERAVDILYGVRCDVVHEGRYFEFHLAEEGDPDPVLSHWGGGYGVARMSLSQLRQIILEGAVRGVQMLVPGMAA